MAEGDTEFHSYMLLTVNIAEMENVKRQHRRFTSFNHGESILRWWSGLLSLFDFNPYE